MNKEKVRGAQLLARLRYVRSLGTERTLRIVASLEPEVRVGLDERKIVPSSWYPAELMLKFDEAIATEAGGGRDAVLVALGQFTAEASFGPTGTLRPYAGKNDPHALLRAVPQVHAGLAGAGERGYARVGPRTALVRAVMGSRGGGSDCLTHVGWLQRAIERCGGRDVQVVETACIGRGGSCCEYRCEWR